MNVLVPIPFDLSSMMHGRNLRVAHVLRRLQDHCEITCLAPEDGLAESASRVLPDLPVLSAQRISAAHVPIQASYWGSRAMMFYGWDQGLANAVASRAAKADIVLGFGAGSANYLWIARQATRHLGHKPRIVGDLIDAPYLTWQSMGLRDRLSLTGLKSLICLQILERQVLRSFDALTTVAPRDAESLSQATRRVVNVVPNGVETDNAPSHDNEREPLIVFTGKMDFPPNEAAACYLVNEIRPRVQSRLNGASLRIAIVGADPSPAVQALASVQDVEVTGRVDDLGAWLKRARVAAVPMVSGSGIKNKILEACAACCPVVTTSIGADGLPQGESNGIVVADSPEVFADQIVRWMTDCARAEQAGHAGWNMVRRQYSWAGVTEQLVAVMRGLDTGSAKVLSPWLPPSPHIEVSLHATT